MTGVQWEYKLSKNMSYHTCSIDIFFGASSKLIIAICASIARKLIQKHLFVHVVFSWVSIIYNDRSRAWRSWDECTFSSCEDLHHRRKPCASAKLPLTSIALCRGPLQCHKHMVPAKNRNRKCYVISDNGEHGGCEFGS